MTTNGIQTSMTTQPVINLSNNNPLFHKSKAIKSGSFTDTLAKVQFQEKNTAQENMSHEELNASQGISVEDGEYLQAVLFPDGSKIYFPPDTASVATKKAWIDSMKKMTNFQRAMTKARMVFPKEACSSYNDVDYNKMKENELAITAYQDIFRNFKQEMENKQGNANNLAEKNDCRQMIQAWDILINTFSNYNVK